MKGSWIFWLLAAALITAMMFTLLKGGNRSRHGYGLAPSIEHQQLAIDQGGPWSTG